MKKTFKIALTSLIVMVLTVTCFSTTVKAEPDYTDTTYWNNLCTNTSSLTKEQEKACDAYIAYMQEQNESLKSQIEDINANKTEISKNISTYASQLTSYNNQIADMNDMIADLNIQIYEAESQITTKNEEIEANKVLINEKEKEIESIKTNIKNRMVSSQETMRLNEYYDVIMGAKSFNDLLRIINGINMITDHDNNNMESLNAAVDELNAMQEQLLTDQQALQLMQEQLENGKATLASQQSSLLTKAYETKIIEKEYTTQLNTVNSQLSAVQSSIDSNNANINDINNPSTQAPSGGGEASSGGPSSGGSSENPYTGGWANCTWGAWQLVHDNLGISLPRFPGGAGAWMASASALGYGTGSTPQVNSIACMTNHVAFVTQVSGDRIYIKEGNYLGAYGERWISISQCTGFIYI